MGGSDTYDESYEVPYIRLEKAEADDLSYKTIGSTSALNGNGFPQTTTSICATDYLPFIHRTRGFIHTIYTPTELGPDPFTLEKIQFAFSNNSAGTAWSVGP